VLNAYQLFGYVDSACNCLVGYWTSVTAGRNGGFIAEPVLNTTNKEICFHFKDKSTSEYQMHCVTDGTNLLGFQSKLF
jgi:hypothetical protein